MKKLLILALLFVLAGCYKKEGQDRMGISSEGEIVKIASREEGHKYCYEGVVYVSFSWGNSTWGSVKFDKVSGTPVTCK